MLFCVVVMVMVVDVVGVVFDLDVYDDDVIDGMCDDELLNFDV